MSENKKSTVLAMSRRPPGYDTNKYHFEDLSQFVQASNNDSRRESVDLKQTLAFLQHKIGADKSKSAKSIRLTPQIDKTEQILLG